MIERQVLLLLLAKTAPFAKTACKQFLHKRYIGIWEFPNLPAGKGLTQAHTQHTQEDGQNTTVQQQIFGHNRTPRAILSHSFAQISHLPQPGGLLRWWRVICWQLHRKKWVHSSAWEDSFCYMIISWGAVWQPLRRWGDTNCRLHALKRMKSSVRAIVGQLRRRGHQRTCVWQWLRRRGHRRMCIWQWLRSARRRWQLWRWRLYAALGDTTTRSIQEEYVLSMAPSRWKLAARRVVPSKTNWGEYVLLMVQRLNFAAMRDVPSRLSVGEKCKGHAGPAEMFDGSCSIEGCHNSGAMSMVNKVLVCGIYPCMSHSGKGARCCAKGCPKYFTPVLQGRKAPDDLCLPSWHAT